MVSVKDQQAVNGQEEAGSVYDHDCLIWEEDAVFQPECAAVILVGVGYFSNMLAGGKVDSGFENLLDEHRNERDDAERDKIERTLSEKCRETCAIHKEKTRPLPCVSHSSSTFKSMDAHPMRRF